jgi:A/G-specific adenine glycosylase
MMDFGSTVCKPKKMDCIKCTFSSNCEAYNSNSVMLYPLKKKKIKIKDRFLNYVVEISDDNKTRIRKRTNSGIWKNLYEFPLIETKQECSVDQIINNLDINFLELKSIKKTKHKLSHQLLHITFFIFRSSKVIDDFISINSLSNYPFPKPINNFISELV